MRHHLGAIFGGAIALSALSAIGAGAGAATPATAPGGSRMDPPRVAAVQQPVRAHDQKEGDTEQARQAQGVEHVHQRNRAGEHSARQVEADE